MYIDVKSLYTALWEEKEKIFACLNNIVEYIPASIYWKDINSIILGGSQLHAEIAGFSDRREVVGKSDYEFIWREQAGAIIKNDQFVMDNNETLIFEETAKLRDGNIHTFLTRKSPLKAKLGETIGVLGVSLDITELKETQSKLEISLIKAEAASQAKTEFLENMSHDIRTPVAGIVGCAQLIQSQASDVAKVTEFTTDLIESSDALLEFLNKILESIKVASGEIPNLKKKFNLCKTLEQIIQLNKPYAISKKLSLNFSYDNAISKYVIGDPFRIQKIVLELLTNALKYTEKGQIQVAAYLMEGKKGQMLVKLSVSDTGMGIPLAQQNEVYTRFKRLTPAYQGTYPGTGLGLSVVKQFIDDLGGEISLKSQPQQGSTFTCLIPLQEPLSMDHEDVEEIVPIASKGLKRALAHNESESSTGFSKASVGRVLVVEDQAIAAKIAQHVLTKLHYQVDIAESGEMALERIKKHHYDLILMDVGLPDNDGGEVTRRIRLQQWKRNPSVPIVGLTAHIDAENKRRCIDAGMNAIYTKPLTAEKAAEIVNAFIPHHQKMPSQVVINTEMESFKELPVLDIDRAIQFMGSKEFLKEGLALLVNGLTEELAMIKQRHQEKDWQAIQALAHKWRGGASYCGTRRLEEVCQQLETHLQAGGSFEHAEALYQQLIQEAEAAKGAAEQYIS